MRNLPAFRSVRKAVAAALLAIGGAGWVAAALAYARPEAPAPQVEAGGAQGLGAVWDATCPPVVASSRGRRYYWAWCEGAGGLKRENLRRFCGPEAAEAAGLAPAKGCGEGLVGQLERGGEPPQKTLIFGTHQTRPLLAKLSLFSNVL